MGCLEAAMVPLVGDEVRRGYTGINSLNLRIVCSSPYRPTKHIERTIHKYEEYNTIHPKRGSLGRCSVVGPMPLGRASGTLLADIGIPWWKRQGRSTGVPGRPGVGISQHPWSSIGTVHTHGSEEATDCPVRGCEQLVRPPPSQQCLVTTRGTQATGMPRSCVGGRGGCAPRDRGRWPPCAF